MSERAQTDCGALMKRQPYQPLRSKRSGAEDCHRPRIVVRAEGCRRCGILRSADVSTHRGDGRLRVINEAVLIIAELNHGEIADGTRESGLSGEAFTFSRFGSMLLEIEMGTDYTLL
jgi:hypothetical protein